MKKENDNLKLAKQEIDEAVARGDEHIVLSQKAAAFLTADNPNKEKELYELLIYSGRFFGHKLLLENESSMPSLNPVNIGTTRGAMTRCLPFDGTVFDAKGAINIDPKDLIIDYCNPIGDKLTPEQREHYKNMSEEAKKELLYGIDEGLVWADRFFPKPRRDALSKFLRKTNAGAKQEKKDYGWYRKFEGSKKWN